MSIADLIASIVKNGIANDEERALLGNSLFYYCSGKDPTPVIAFGADYPLYIYSDTDPDFISLTSGLYRRLQESGFKLIDSRSFRGGGRWEHAPDMDAAQWEAADGNAFCVLCLQNDAEDSFQHIYRDMSNFIQPKCICNVRYEFFDTHSADFFQQIEKRTEYILGYCYSNKHKEVCEYRYYGDYGQEEAVKLYRRMYWYVY